MIRRPTNKDELFRIEEADAWFEYLDTLRNSIGFRYEEMEPWAWTRLSERLRRVAQRRERMAVAA